MSKPDDFEELMRAAEVAHADGRMGDAGDALFKAGVAILWMAVNLHPGAENFFTCEVETGEGVAGTVTVQLAGGVTPLVSLKAQRDEWMARAQAAEADRDWHRARVPVTDDDIREAGLGDPDVMRACPRLAAWVEACPELDMDRSTGVYRVRPNGDEWLCYHGTLMAHALTINGLAKDVGRPPLDVLAEIAAMEATP